MAGYKGHIGGATLFCFIYVVVLLYVFSIDVFVYQGAMLENWQFVAALFILAILFGLWPDVDTNSKGQDIFYFYGGIFLLDVLLLATGQLEAAAYVGLLALLPILGKHRGWTHHPLSMVLVPLPILAVPYLYHESNLAPAAIYYGAAVVGYFSHLYFDGLIRKLFKKLF